jgi:transposase
VLVETEDNEEIIQRVAALDVGKAELGCCVRVPGEGGKRLQEVRPFSTMTRSLLSMSDHLREVGVTRVVMEATSDYWKPIFYLLEAAGFETWLVNARDVKHLPGRPKTDKLDAVWLCKVAERQMIRPSFVPPPEIRRLRDVTRYRIDLVNARTAEKNRVEKLLEDACIKLSVVASDIFGVSGRDMMAALIAGERDPKRLAQLARSRMRTKIALLEEAFTGHFTDHHAFLLQRMLTRIDAINTDIAALETKIEEMVTPFTEAIARLDDIPGIHPRGVATSIALRHLPHADQRVRPAPQHHLLQVPDRGQVPGLRRLEDLCRNRRTLSSCTAAVRSASENPPAPRVFPAAHDMDDRDRVLTASARPEPIRSGRQPGLPLWFRCVPGACLVGTVGDHGNPERPAFSIGFRYIHSADRQGLEGPCPAVHLHGQLHPGTGGQGDLSLETVRHEALCDRVEVKGLRRWVVAAA